ncbi:hypothetical protein H5410_015181 [Solanum commersonii]|uniref:Uncharacterized protein n=1 Tax=Solanum commersonii TaxID=4109 RepID=A0A9J5ZSV6_SOLCO|nr:hypothetical protein H5410_015181 [Solanum commersonii]
MEYSVIPYSLNLENSTSKNWESSCSFCEICENAFPLPNTCMQGSNCNHRYCEEYIQNYVGAPMPQKYDGGCIPFTIDFHEISIKCLVSGYKGILDLNSIMSIDFLMRCPVMDCMGTLVDDMRDTRLGNAQSVENFYVSIRRRKKKNDMKTKKTMIKKKKKKKKEKGRKLHDQKH